MSSGLPLRIAFRADAATWMGSGHIMRCATLASHLQQANAEIHFICRELPGDYCAWLERSGFMVHRLTASRAPLPDPQAKLAHASWLGVALQQEIEESHRVMRAHGPFDWLVVDHYALDADWENAMAPTCRQIMVIDDLADRPHACSLLLDQNLQAEKDAYAERLPASAKKLIGPRFALLRPQFSTLRANSQGHSGALQHLLIFMSGSDPENLTGKILAALGSTQLPQTLHINIVIGQQHPALDQLTAEYATRPGYSLHIQTSQMAELMQAADLMIGAAGTTSWERCCLGLPAILFSLSANQRQNGKLLARQKAAIYLGEANAATLGRLPRLISHLTRHPGLLRRMAGRAAACVDGQGVRRVGSLLQAAWLDLRPARPADCIKIWRWRNDPRTRRAAFDSAAIDRPRHEQWFAGILADPERILLIGRAGNQEIGVLRYDPIPDGWEISVYLDPDLHGLGLGSPLIEAGSRWLAEHRPPNPRITAQVRPDNPASCAVFRKAGFRQVGSAFLWQTPPAAATSAKE